MLGYVAWWVAAMEFARRRLRPKIKGTVVVCRICGTGVKGPGLRRLLVNNECDGCGVPLTEDDVY